MQTLNSSGSNQKSEEPMGSEEGFGSHVPSHPYMRYRPHSSRILNHQGSAATTIRCDDSDLIINNSVVRIPTIDRLEAATQSAVSFESTQSNKPHISARDCLDVEPVQRAVSEPPSTFPTAVRQG
ncbi:unnamed protein product [Rodentolepis nana]|uniref:Uncharacterized protein n=1 Tax=Rodentolepis nana TaxID=102285 RepID=A0A0R3TCH0_RODNA|nr:unnamed protein product [Rodentolepis nana]